VLPQIEARSAALITQGALIEIPHCSEPLTFCSPIRYAVTLARAADAYRLVEETRVAGTRSFGRSMCGGSSRI
jgi:hypothetical protein